jgi:hypothetical protein
MKSVVGYPPRDIFEMHFATLAMDHDNPLVRHPGNRRLPVPAGTTEGPEGSCERHVGV